MIIDLICCWFQGCGPTGEEGTGNTHIPELTQVCPIVCVGCACVCICLFAIFSMIMTLYSLTVHGNNNQTMPRKTDMWTIKCIKSLLKNKILVGHTFSKYHVDTYISYSYITDVSPTRKPLSCMACTAYMYVDISKWL